LFSGNFIIFENYLKPLESLTIIQSQQLINIIEYLYNCRIIHRDLRPDNLMLDLNQQHIKLIDFGFATTYEIDEMPKTLPIEGAISYGCLRFLKHYHNLLSNDLDIFYYEYERTFDLQCAINIMMYLTDDKIKEKMKSIKTVVNVERKVFKLQQLWIDITDENDNYSKILNVPMEKYSL
jgi:serine/threonine protein kinase